MAASRGRTLSWRLCRTAIWIALLGLCSTAGGVTLGDNSPLIGEAGEDYEVAAGGGLNTASGVAAAILGGGINRASSS